MSDKGHNCNLCKKAKCFLPIGNVCFGEKHRGKIIQENDEICGEYEFGGFIELSEKIVKITESRQMEIDRMSISEQVKELRKWANCVHLTGHNYEILNQAADTIESLSAKLQAANMVRSAAKRDRLGNCTTCELDIENGYCKGMFKESVTDNERKKIPDWCPLNESEVDYGGGWIYCGDGRNLPEEHDSIFARFKGTDKWSNEMFEKTSDEVNVTIEFEDGKRTVKTLHTIDGRWNEGNRGLKFKIIAWQPLPEQYHEP